MSACPQNGRHAARNSWVDAWKRVVTREPSQPEFLTREGVQVLHASTLDPVTISQSQVVVYVEQRQPQIDPAHHALIPGAAPAPRQSAPVRAMAMVLCSLVATGAAVTLSALSPSPAVDAAEARELSLPLGAFDATCKGRENGRAIALSFIETPEGKMLNWSGRSFKLQESDGVWQAVRAGKVQGVVAREANALFVRMERARCPEMVVSLDLPLR
jgi:hypothetical protein